MAVLLTVVINKEENNSLMDEKNKHLTNCFVFYCNRFVETHLSRSTTDKHTHQKYHQCVMIDYFYDICCKYVYYLDGVYYIS